jgi:hypothetical protein
MATVGRSATRFLADGARHGAFRQLAVALPRSLPTPHQYADFFVAPDERREMTLSGAASAAARPHDPIEDYRG